MAETDAKGYILLVPPFGIEEHLRADCVKSVACSTSQTFCSGIIIKSICPNPSEIHNVRQTNVRIKQWKMVIET